MNKKILVIGLVTICSAPPSKDTKTLIPTDLWAQIKTGLNHRATANFEQASSLELPRQSLIFKLIKDMQLGFMHTTLPITDEMAERVNQQFPLNGSSLVFEEAIRAINKIWQYIFSKANNFDSLEFQKVPLIYLAIFAANQVKTKAYKIHFYVPELIEIANVANQSEEKDDYAVQALNEAIDKAKNSYSYLRIAQVFYEMEDYEMVDQALQIGLAQKSSIYDYEHIAQAAHKMGNAEKVNIALDTAFDISEDCDTFDDSDHYTSIAKIAHEIGNIEFASKALQIAFDKIEDFSDCPNIAKIAHEIGNEELKNKALQKALDMAATYNRYLHISEIAHEMWNTKLENQALEKALEFAIDPTDISQLYTNLAVEAHQIMNIEFANRAFNKAIDLSNSFYILHALAGQAHKVGNMEMAQLAFIKAKELAQTPDELEIIRKLSEKLNLSLETEPAPAAAQ